MAFSKHEVKRGHTQGTFDFLGFTFYWGRSQKGHVTPKVKTIGKRLRMKLKRVGVWARTVRNVYPLKEMLRRFCVKREGHIRYDGVSSNTAKVKQFVHRAIRILFKWLNRRSQRKSFDWEKCNLFMKVYPPPKVRVCFAFYSSIQSRE